MSQWKLKLENADLEDWEKEWVIDMISFHHLSASAIKIRDGVDWPFTGVDGDALDRARLSTPEHITQILKSLL